MKKKKRINKKKNQYLKPDGGIDLIEKFPGIDYLKYSIKKGKKSIKRIIKEKQGGS